MIVDANIKGTAWLPMGAHASENMLRRFESSTKKSKTGDREEYIDWIGVVSPLNSHHETCMDSKQGAAHRNIARRNPV